MKNFVLVGAAGYIAPRHMEAIQKTGNQLLAALDLSDSVGIIDRYFPQADFFTEFERFDRHLEKIKRSGTRIDYLSICTPNYLHDAHIRFGLRHGIDVICEKPIVLNPWNLSALKEIEQETGRKIFNILQLRLHPSILALRDKIVKGPKDKIYDIELTYLTSRGMWYYASWKGEESKSGGLVSNIGIHFFDMLCWIFGAVKKSHVNIYSHDRAAGYLTLERARVKWFLSINYDLLPEDLKSEGISTYRSLKIEGEEYEFSKGFTDLHIKSYEQILDGKGFQIDKTEQVINLLYEIRNSAPSGLVDKFHPLAKLPLDTHPFRR